MLGIPVAQRIVLPERRIRQGTVTDGIRILKRVVRTDDTRVFPLRRHIIMLPARMLRILERPRRKSADVGEGVSVFVLPIRQQQKFLQRFQVSARPLRWIVGGGLVSPRTQVEEKGLLAD